MMAWHLLRPEWLLALLPLSVLVWRMTKPGLEQSSWSRVCDPHLLPHILHHPRQGVAHWAPWWVAGVGSLLILAMAGPVWHRQPQPVFHTQSAMVLLLDLSRSMDATDLKPSRLVRAKHKLVDLLRRRREGQTAFLVFAGEAFVVTPLTHDTATIMAQLASLDTALMPVQGSRPDRAVHKAIELLHQGGVVHGHIVLMTDEWTGDDQMASRVVKAGHMLTILGVGTPAGAPIPLVDGGFLNDAHGAIVMAKLDEPRLQQLALLGGGRYQTIRTDDQDVDALLALQQAPALTAGIEKTEFMSDNWQEEGPWLVLVVLPLIALVFRRGILVVLWGLCWLPGPVQAVDWETLWQRPDQRAMQQWEAGNVPAAAHLFTDPAWRGAAHYRAGEYEQAVADWQASHATEDLYNKGTALAHLGRLPEAAQAFTEVLQHQPDHADARYNLDQVQKAMNAPNQPAANQSPPDQQKQSGAKQAATPGDGQKGTPEQAQKQAQSPGQPPPESHHAADKSPAKPSPNQANPPQTANDKPVPEANQPPATPKTEGPQTPLAQEEQSKESQVATEQWLRRVPDDPGGLLRRKFRYQYQHEGAPEKTEEDKQRW
ncbi:MAG: VWA domain-containing protein [Magnetococcales bacterium]|nr:VWA domain-containing protein [Magnetococcales bacterium]